MDQGCEGGGEERGRDMRDRNGGDSRGVPRLGRQSSCRDGEGVTDTLAMWPVCLIYSPKFGFRAKAVNVILHIDSDLTMNSLFRDGIFGEFCWQYMPVIGIISIG